MKSEFEFHTEEMRKFYLILTILILMFFSCNLASAATHCDAPHFSSIRDGFRYDFPPSVQKSGLVFAGSQVPIQRRDVRYRILRELNVLLQDKRSKVLQWLSRSDNLKPTIAPILAKYDLPPEFLFLSAIESSYDGRALSSAGAFGYWQFIKATAVCGPKGCDEYDWKMNINKWKDERADLTNSTHSAARYLAWMNRMKKISLDEKGDKEGFGDWLLTAAAYNAGPTRVVQRMNLFRATSYWDVGLPIETEKYVPKWIAISLISGNRDYYGVNIPQSGSFAFDTIENLKLEKDLSLVAMAKILHTTPREVCSLNSQLISDKGAFPAKSGKTAIPHTVHVPKGAKSKFLAQLAAHGYTKNK